MPLTTANHESAILLRREVACQPEYDDNGRLHFPDLEDGRLKLSPRQLGIARYRRKATDQGTETAEAVSIVYRSDDDKWFYSHDTETLLWMLYIQPPVEKLDDLPNAYDDKVGTLRFVVDRDEYYQIILTDGDARKWVPISYAERNRTEIRENEIVEKVRRIGIADGAGKFTFTGYDGNETVVIKTSVSSSDGTVKVSNAGNNYDLSIQPEITRATRREDEIEKNAQGISVEDNNNSTFTFTDYDGNETTINTGKSISSQDGTVALTTTDTNVDLSVAAAINVETERAQAAEGGLQTQINNVFSGIYAITAFAFNTTDGTYTATITDFSTGNANPQTYIVPVVSLANSGYMTADMLNDLQNALNEIATIQGESWVVISPDPVTASNVGTIWETATGSPASDGSKVLDISTSPPDEWIYGNLVGGGEQWVFIGNVGDPVAFSEGTYGVLQGGNATLTPSGTAVQGNVVVASGGYGYIPAVDTINSLLNSHIANTSNPHGVTQSQVGLGSVDNTSDLNKPISTATQTALNNKAQIGQATASSGYAISSITLNASAAPTVASSIAIPTTLPPNGAAGGVLSGNYPNPEIASVTLANSALPSAWPTGFRIGVVYGSDKGYPAAYGSIFSMKGTTSSSVVQIFVEWSGTNSGSGGMWWRNARDNYDGFSAWTKALESLVSSTTNTISGNQVQRAALQGDVTATANSNDTTVQKITQIASVTLAQLNDPSTISGFGDGKSILASIENLDLSSIGLGTGCYGTCLINRRRDSSQNTTYEELLTLFYRGSRANEIWYRSRHSTDAQNNFTRLAFTTDIPSIPASLPPNGTAGGDLAGTYPNPTVPGLSRIVNNQQSGNLFWQGGWYVQVNTGCNSTIPTDIVRLTRSSSYGATRIISIPVDKTESSAGYIEWLSSNANFGTITGLGSTPNITPSGNTIDIPMWTSIVGRHTRGGNHTAVTLYALYYNQSNATQLLQPGDVILCTTSGILENIPLLLGNGQALRGDVMLRYGVPMPSGATLDANITGNAASATEAITAIGSSMTSSAAASVVSVTNFTPARNTVEMDGSSLSVHIPSLKLQDIIQYIWQKLYGVSWTVYSGIGVSWTYYARGSLASSTGVTVANYQSRYNTYLKLVHISFTFTMTSASPTTGATLVAWNDNIGTAMETQRIPISFSGTATLANGMVWAYVNAVSRIIYLNNRTLSTTPIPVNVMIPVNL